MSIYEREDDEREDDEPDFGWCDHGVAAGVWPRTCPHCLAAWRYERGWDDD